MHELQSRIETPNPDDTARVLDAFDAAWHGPDPPDLVVYAARLPRVPACDRRASLAELVMIDCEQRWKRAPSCALLTLADYVARLPDLGPVDALPAEVIVEECHARWKWGDRPSLQTCLAPFAERVAEVEPRLRAVLDGYRVGFVVYRQGREVFSGEFLEPLEVGRQNRGEPAPTTIVERVDRPSRLVIAPVDARTLSRAHLLLEPDARGVRVTNQSQKRPIELSDGAIEPGEQRHLTPPCTLLLSDIAIRLTPPSSAGA